MATEKEIWCAVANIRYPRKYVKQGAKCYILSDWNWGNPLVLVRSRGGRWIKVHLQLKWMKNFRTQRVYNPSLQKRIAEYGSNWPKSMADEWSQKAAQDSPEEVPYPHCPVTFPRKTKEDSPW